MWTVFRGCRQSFHIVCILPDISDCPICRIALLAKVNDLRQTAHNSVSNVFVTSASEASDEDDNLTNDDDDDDDDGNQLHDDQNKNVTNIDTLLQRSEVGELWSWPTRMTSDKLDILSLSDIFPAKAKARSQYGE